MMGTITEALSRISLYYKGGGSDKEYHAFIEPSGTGFVVNFSYGRRGSTLQTGSKTPQPVEYAEAQKIHDKLVNEKMAKGYTPGEQGTPYERTSRETRSTGILPQLANPITEEQAQLLIADGDWCMQEKFDGKRMLILKSGDTLTAINRNGLAVAMPQPIAESARGLEGGQWLLDGEAVGDVFVAFDLLEQACINLRGQPYSKRLKALYGLVPKDSAAIRAADTAATAAQKRTMLDAMRQANREGVVFKHRSAPHVPGRPASGGNWLKLKFTATASCLVIGSTRGKRSIALQLAGESGNVEVGNVTVPPNHPIPAPGSVVEVKFLYAYRNGSLYQPVLLGIRDDLTASACRLDQLKYKAGEEEEGD
jgi:bifunctional non-homologous end joining protein LigD